MSAPLDYQLENIKNRELKLRTTRREILESSSEEALDMILSAHSPATLIQSFPDQDLYYLLHKIGGDDFIPVLAMARSDQWEYILDMEIWDQDRLDIDGMTKTFDLLFQAAPERLLRWAITTKPDFFEFYLAKNMEIYIREHDETIPDDHKDYTTFDDKFYFRFPGAPGETDPDEEGPVGSARPDELIEKMLDMVARMDLSVFHGLMLETIGLLPAETEEEQFRQKNIRLAEKGFLPTHEAIGIYQPIQFSSIRKRHKPLEKVQTAYDPETPLPPQFFAKLLPEDNLLFKALEQFDAEVFLTLESELAALINKVISADKIKLRSKEDLEKAAEKTNHYLNLGLEIIRHFHKKECPLKDIVNEYFLEDIFRMGARESLALSNKTAQWFQTSFMNAKHLPLSFLGEEFLGVIGGLFLDRPLFFDNYRTGSSLYRDFKSIKDIDITSQVLEQVFEMDKFLSCFSVDLSSFEEGVLTFKSYILTLWAKHRIYAENSKDTVSLEPVSSKDFGPFFRQILEKTENDTDHPAALDLVAWAGDVIEKEEAELSKPLKKLLSALIEEIIQEYGDVNPDQIDPRFFVHFLLK